MARKSEWEKMMQSTIHEFVENSASEVLGKPVKLTKRQVAAYCNAVEESQREEEIACAIDLLVREGYRVTKAKKRA